MIVVDASAVVSALVDSGPAGQWCQERLEHHDLAAPAILPAEVANVLRRAEQSRMLSAETAAQAFADLLALPVIHFPFEAVAERVWDLRGSVTAYDAWYVAVAEGLDVPLITLDLRLVRAAGAACQILTP